MTEEIKPTPNKVFKKVWVSNRFNLLSPFKSLSRWIATASYIPNFLKYVFVRLKFKKEQTFNIFTKREKMRYILDRDDYISRQEIISAIKSDYIKIGLNNIMLLFESSKQRTYLVKTDEEFFLFFYNKGKLVMVLRQTLDMFQYQIVEDIDNRYFKILFIGFKKPFYVNVAIFKNIETLKIKLETL